MQLKKKLEIIYAYCNEFKISIEKNIDPDHPRNLAKTVTVPADTTLVVLDTPIYLMEADVLKGGASANSDLDLFVSYEILDDA